MPNQKKLLVFYSLDNPCMFTFCTIMYQNVFRAIALHSVGDIETRESNSDSTDTCRETATSRRAEAPPRAFRSGKISVVWHFSKEPMQVITTLSCSWLPFFLTGTFFEEYQKATERKKSTKLLLKSLFIIPEAL